MDYDYIKNHYRLIPLDLNRQKELHADSKATQQIEFIGQLKKPDDKIVANESMFALTTLERIKETRVTFSQRSVSLIKDGTL